MCIHAALSTSHDRSHIEVTGSTQATVTLLDCQCREQDAARQATIDVEVALLRLHKVKNKLPLSAIALPG